MESSSFVSKLDKRDKEVFEAFKVFEDFYGHSFRRTRISEIIDGENIKIKDDNINLDEEVDESIVPVEQIRKLFDVFCTKKPYEYQFKAICKILEMETKQVHLDPVTNKHIRTNAVVLALPIGSGKSLVFEFLALFFNKVPIHPIIISTNGDAICETDQVPFENYPFYYENCAYVEEDATAVQAIETELQRECTVILTYRHLLAQLKQYFAEDFKPAITKQRKIEYFDYHELANDKKMQDASWLDNVQVLVVVADEANVNKLIELSYQKPFARVIIDDYTNMSDLSRLREILTFSFIPVSGSGFEKSINEIPSSYYSLKNVPSEKLKLVGNPEKTYEGVMRSNIMTGDIMTSKSEFDVYSFVSMIEDLIHRLPGCEKETPLTLFKEFQESQRIELYIKYGFFIQNITTFKRMLPSLIQDLNHGAVADEPVSHFIEWANNTEDNLFKRLMTTPNNGNETRTYPTLVNSKCVVCKRTKDQTYGFGVIASCCGAFICSECIDKAATREIVDVNPKEIRKLVMDDYYCVCCRDKHPRYYFNSTQHSAGSETRSFVFADRYFEHADVEGHFSIDYYFRMLKSGWDMRLDCCNGRAINIHNDISQGVIDVNVFKTKKIEIEKIRNGDLLFPQVLTAIYNTYKELKLKPVDNSILLVYRCKPILQQRMQDRFNELASLPDSPFKTLRLSFHDTVGSVIGLSMNIMGLVIYNSEDEEFFSMVQLLGRLLRISSYGQKILFYVNNDTNAYV